MCAGNGEKTGQNCKVSQDKVGNGPKWSKTEPNMVGNGEKNQNLG